MKRSKMRRNVVCFINSQNKVSNVVLNHKRGREGGCCARQQTLFHFKSIFMTPKFGEGFQLCIRTMLDSGFVIRDLIRVTRSMDRMPVSWVNCPKWIIQYPVNSWMNWVNKRPGENADVSKWILTSSQSSRIASGWSCGQIYVEQKTWKNKWIFLIMVNITSRNCLIAIQASGCMGWLMSCLETAKVWFFPVTFLNLNFLTASFVDNLIFFLNASIWNELDLQPVDDTCIPHSFIGRKLCSFEPVSQEFVRKLICNSAPKSCVLNPIPTTLLKLYLDDLVPLVCRILNKSFLSGSVSQQFMEAVMTPLLRKQLWCK